MITEPLYIGSGNIIVWRFSYDRDITNTNNVVIAKKGDPVPFITNGVTKIELYINGQVVSSSNSTRIKWFDGRIEIDLDGVEGIQPKKKYPISLKVWDAAHPVKGQVIAHPRSNSSSIRIDAVSSEM